MSTIHDTIRGQVEEHKIVLYMKGTPQFPQCGFSAKTAELLKKAGAEGFHAVDVLADEEIRQGIKTYSNWPTIPQLYIKGEFVGGCDIVTEMYESGELKKLVDSAAE